MAITILEGCGVGKDTGRSDVLGSQLFDFLQPGRDREPHPVELRVPEGPVFRLRSQKPRLETQRRRGARN